MCDVNVSEPRGCDICVISVNDFIATGTFSISSPPLRGHPLNIHRTFYNPKLHCFLFSMKILTLTSFFPHLKHFSGEMLLKVGISLRLPQRRRASTVTRCLSGV